MKRLLARGKKVVVLTKRVPVYDDSAIIHRFEYISADPPHSDTRNKGVAHANIVDSSRTNVNIKP